MVRDNETRVCHCSCGRKMFGHSSVAFLLRTRNGFLFKCSTFALEFVENTAHVHINRTTEVFNVGCASDLVLHMYCSNVYITTSIYPPSIFSQ